MPIHREPVSPPAEQSFRLLHWKQNPVQIEMLVSPGRSVPLAGAAERWHAHPAMELTLILSGSGTRFIGDEIAPVSPPELVLIGPDMPHYWRGLRPSSGYVAQFEFGEHHAFWQFPEFQNLKTLWQKSARGLLFSGRTRQRVIELLDTMPAQRQVERFATLLRIFAILTDAPGSEQRLLSSKVFRLTAGDPHRAAIENAIHLIADHCQEALSLLDIADAVHMSRATFCRHFHRLTGRSFVGFLNDVRIDHARRRLVEGRLGVAQVADEAGFGNLSNFNRVFLRRMGQTPSEYRRRAAITQVRPPHP
ncbi:MAG TPA: AraC family transcriptional regulator [Planctomycetota bacterium]|jgi:AraC-like DNA-binding protein